MRLKDRVILITGGGQGIGRQIALRVATEGAAVVILGLEQGPLTKTTAEIEALGQNAFGLIADVSHESQVNAAVKTAHQQTGRIDVLVNNAAIIGPTGPVHELLSDDWDEVLAVNLTGAFLCCKAVLPDMITRRSGKIINIASVAGKQSYPLRAPYGVSKWGLIGLTLTLAKEVGGYNIQVNAVCPGPVEGERMQRVIESRARELEQSADAVRESYLRTTVLGRMARAEDVAAVVAFLASAEADNITGQAIDVSAGYGL